MLVWRRLFLVWLLALALPVQGIAGAAMAHCGASHQRMAAGLQAAPHAHEGAAAGHRHAGPAAGAGHRHAAAPGAEEARHHGHAAADPGAAADGADAEADARAELARYSCSSCAACCAGTALPSAALRVPRGASVAEDFIEPAAHVEAFVSDGPERPPRSRLV
jgi:hypothetical protein